MRSIAILLAFLVLRGGVPAALSEGRFDAAAERELVRRVNEERAKAGLAALEVDDRLTGAARQHTLLMAGKGVLTHQFPGEPTLMQRLVATGMRLNNDGENVALDSGTVADAHRGLMESPPHRANILQPGYNTIGVGVVRQGNLLYVTEDFAHRQLEYSPPQAENAAAETFASLHRKVTALPAQRMHLPNLRRMACSMAERDRLNAQLGSTVPDAHYAVAYTQGEPQRLPSNAVRLAADPGIKAFGIGACYAATRTYPGGIWWVLMVFY